MKKFYAIVFLIVAVQLAFGQKVSVPQLVSPENDIEKPVMPDVTMDWDAVSGVGEITYQLQLSTDESFTNIVADESGINITAYTPELLDFGQQYFWRVKGFDDIGSSDWSSTFTFIVFSLVFPDDPINGETGFDIRPRLKWDDRTIERVKIEGNFPGFQIELDTVPSFDSPLYQLMPSGGVVFEKLTDYLLFGTEYFWRLRAYHESSVGEWSEVWSFETVAGTLLDEPSNNASDLEFDQTLKWEALNTNDDGGVLEYTLEVSTDEDFSLPITQVYIDINEASPDFLKFGTDYWWRVKVGHENDDSEWTEVRKFSMIGSVVLNAPSNGEVLNTMRPTLEWEEIAGVGGYQIILSKSPDYSDPTFYLVENPSTNEYPLPELEKDSDYFWSVRSFLGTDTSEWADQYQFNVPFDVGIGEAESLSDISIFPNPATTHLSFSFNITNTSKISYTITDILGKSVFKKMIQAKPGYFTERINLDTYNRGIYFLEVEYEDHRKVKKFIIK